MPKRERVRVGSLLLVRNDELWYQCCGDDKFPIGVVGETLLLALLRCRKRLARVTEDWVPIEHLRRRKPGPPYTLKQAQRLRVCRVCGEGGTDGPGLPFLYDYGREYAHQKCLR